LKIKKNYIEKIKYKPQKCFVSLIDNNTDLQNKKNNKKNRVKKFLKTLGLQGNSRNGSINFVLLVSLERAVDNLLPYMSKELHKASFP